MLVKLSRMLLYQASTPNDQWGWTKALYICFNVHDCSSGLILLIIANNWAIFLHFAFVFFFQLSFLSIHILKNLKWSTFSILLPRRIISSWLSIWFWVFWNNMHLVLPMLSESLLAVTQWEIIFGSLELTLIVRLLRSLLLKSRPVSSAKSMNWTVFVMVDMLLCGYSMLIPIRLSRLLSIALKGGSIRQFQVSNVPVAYPCLQSGMDGPSAN